MKIDAHQHFWQYDAEKYSWISDEMSAIRNDFSPEDLEPLLSKSSFSGCVAVQADQSEAETEVLLKMAKKHDFIKGVVGWIDLASPEVEERLKHYSKNTFLKCIRHTVWDEKGEFMTSSEFQHGIISAGRHDGKPGFLNDRRRVNVAISRFRDQLIFVCHRRMLQASIFWKTMAHYLAQCCRV